MTPSRYFLAQMGQAFGYYRKAQRMGDAASEMHLLREAETMLGSAIWENVENIDELSVEYWNLRKLVKEREEIQQRLEDCQIRLTKAHEERSILLNNTPEENLELLEQRTKILNHLEELSRKRDNIVASAREVRRAYVGFKTKLEVLTGENTSSDNPEDFERVKSQLVMLKNKFAALKSERIEVGKEIDAGDAELDKIDEQLEQKRQERREMASGAFVVIGEGNKEISTLKAECGLIDTRMRQLYAEIGRFVSRSANQNPAAAAAAKSHRGMVDVMRALRRSIALNHRLAGTA
ncbi:MAG: hypothetical protein ACQCXQ_04980 [Verrucomicrobiales bacterium]|nr:hypothetical protein [Verrucomicrobiota bacterium JB025]